MLPLRSICCVEIYAAIYLSKAYFLGFILIIYNSDVQYKYFEFQRLHEGYKLGHT
jgi:hypothetical protein